jgi:hypothetical protein
MLRVNLMPALSPLFAVRRAVAFAVVAAWTSACYIGGDTGLPPPTTQFYFPTGLAVSPGRTALYVANSDFDLQFSGGTVQVLDLSTLRESLDRLRDNFASGADPAVACDLPTIKLQPNPNPILTPSPCMPIPLDSPAAPVVHSAEIGAFATGMVLASDSAFPADPAAALSRLFVPVQGDPSVTWFNIADDRTQPATSPCTNGDSFCLDCGQTADGDDCADNHRMGLSPYDNTRYLTEPPEPAGIAASDDGRTLVTTQQTLAEVAVEENPWGPPDVASETWTPPSDPSVCQDNPFACGVPTLQYVHGSLAAGPTGVAAIPTPALAQQPLSSFYNSTFNYQPGFLVSYNQTAEVDLLTYYADDWSSPPRPFLTLAAVTPLAVNANGRDSLGIAVDCSARKSAENECPTTNGLPCLAAALTIPCGVFIANRTPTTLVVGQLQSEVENTPCGGLDGDPCSISSGADCCSGTCDTTTMTCVGGTTASGIVDSVTITSVVDLAPGPSTVARADIIGLDGQKHSRIFVVLFDSRYIYMVDPNDTGAPPIPIFTGRGPQPIAFDTGDSYSYMYVGHFTDSNLGVVDLDMRHSITFGNMFATIGAPIPPIESQ